MMLLLWQSMATVTRRMCKSILHDRSTTVDVGSRPSSNGGVFIFKRLASIAQKTVCHPLQAEMVKILSRPDPIPVDRYHDPTILAIHWHPQVSISLFSGVATISC